jgi:hypothetical protein
MKVHPIEPGADTNALLPGAQFADAFSVVVNDDAFETRLEWSVCRAAAITR